MKKLSWTLAAVLLAGAAVAAARAAENELSGREKADGWKLLFDGRTLDGWKATGNSQGWLVQDGTIFCAAMRGGYLHTVDQYDDFVLALDYKVAPRVNSGVFFRWSDLKDPVHTGIEMQVYDS